MQRQKTIITVHVEGGMVQDINGIPPEVEVRVEDFDLHDESHPHWNSQKGCIVTIFEGAIA